MSLTAARSLVAVDDGWMSDSPSCYGVLGPDLSVPVGTIHYSLVPYALGHDRQAHTVTPMYG